MNIFKFIVLMFLLFIIFNIIKYHHLNDDIKKCNTIYIPLVDKFKEIKGYEKDDNLTFIKYLIK